MFVNSSDLRKWIIFVARSHFANFFVSFAANLKVSSFDLILSLEFLLKIVEFVTIPEDSVAKPVVNSSAVNVPTASKAIVKRKLNENSEISNIVIKSM